MDDDELRELEDPASWDQNGVEARPAVRNARGVVAVEFAGEDLERLARSAAEAGMSLAAFVRHAALEKAAHSSVPS